MTVQEALEAFAENCEYLHEMPEMLCQIDPAVSIRFLMSEKPEDFQYRQNEEWLELIREENDPVQASKLLLDWYHDKINAWHKQKDDEMDSIFRDEIKAGGGSGDAEV